MLAMQQMGNMAALNGQRMGGLAANRAKLSSMLLAKRGIPMNNPAMLNQAMAANQAAIGGSYQGGPMVKRQTPIGGAYQGIPRMMGR